MIQSLVQSINVETRMALAISVVYMSDRSEQKI